MLFSSDTQEWVVFICKYLAPLTYSCRRDQGSWSVKSIPPHHTPKPVQYVHFTFQFQPKRVSFNQCFCINKWPSLTIANWQLIQNTFCSLYFTYFPFNCLCHTSINHHIWCQRGNSHFTQHCYLFSCLLVFHNPVISRWFQLAEKNQSSHSQSQSGGATAVEPEVSVLGCSVLLSVFLCWTAQTSLCFRYIHTIVTRTAEFWSRFGEKPGRKVKAVFT